MKIKPDNNNAGVTFEIERAEETDLLAGRTLSFVNIKKILVPVDFSRCSRRAVEYAVAFARQFEAQVVLVHVVELDYAAIEMSPLDITAVQRQVAANVKTKLDAFAEDLEIGHVEIESRVRTGKVRQELLAEADQFCPDLIIVGTHGSTGLRHAVLGSVAEAIVRHAKCPALTVREKEHEIISL